MTSCVFATALVTVPAADQRGARGRALHTARYRAVSTHRQGRSPPPNVVPMTTNDTIVVIRTFCYDTR